MIYLGTLGRMIGLKCPSSLSTDHGDRYTMTRTIEGGVRAQARPLTARQWQLGLSDASTPADLALLQDFARGAWGPGPWIFLSSEAVNTNILTPRQASFVDREQLADWSDGGPVTVSDGSIAPTSVLSVATASWSTIFKRIPIKPGQPVTWTAEIEGSGTVVPELAMAFYSSIGTNLGGHISGGTASPGMQRVSMTRTPPALATSVYVGINYTAKRIARPQVTWTGVAPPVFSDGRGCSAAVLHGVSEGLTLTWDTQTFMNAGFTVSEVL